MKNKLEEYIEDIDDIFETAKKEVNYASFMRTVKLVYGLELLEVMERAKDTVSHIYEHVDNEYLLDMLVKMQLHASEMLSEIKIINDRRVQFVMDFNPGSEFDSTLASKADLEAFNKDFNDY